MTIATDPASLRKAFVARLTSKIPSAAVVSTRGYEFPRDEAPAINVFSPGSDSDGRSLSHSSFDRVERIMVAATVVVDRNEPLADMDEAIGDAVDAMELAIKVAILSWRDMQRSIRRYQSMSVRKGQSGDGEDLRGHVAVEFRLLVDEEVLWEDPISTDGDLDVLGMTVQPGTPDEPTYEIRPDLS